MEFLWPILAKMELICQQTQVSGVNPSSGVPERMTGGWWDGLAMVLTPICYVLLSQCKLFIQRNLVNMKWNAGLYLSLFCTHLVCLNQGLNQASNFFLITQCIKIYNTVYYNMLSYRQPLPVYCVHLSIVVYQIFIQIAKFMGPTWGPPGSCRPQMGPMSAQWTLLSGSCII